jgi:NADH-quinone oxidoreductase subunit H
LETCINIIDTMSPCLVAGGMHPALAGLISLLAGALLVGAFPLVLTPLVIIYLERKISARIQIRIGPNRVGPLGLLQNIADAVKLIGKEDITPAGADRLIYNLAPIVSIVSVLGIWAVVPFSPLHIGVDLDIGLLYVMAISSVGALAIMMAGWSSNNKYALLGALRVVAQLVSYEIPLVLAALVPVMLSGSMSMQSLVHAQGGMWFIILCPLAAFIFFVANLSETGRPPFDLIEAESELVAGYNIEYSGMKFGLFMVHDFLHAFTANVLFTVVFLGGWWGPGVAQFPALGFVYFGLKVGVVYLLAMLIRFSLPRLRIDQMMNFNWKGMVPVAVANLLWTALLFKIVQTLGLAPDGNFLDSLPGALILLVGNLLLIGVVLSRVRAVGRQMRQAEAQTLETPPEAATRRWATSGD